ncbi:MAG: roadblock/LC7 domain-containing protein [Candidatus Cryosericum sp.]|jgi:predicted regulator of Ras-like GTPase activity (Roadblock/LC7/MglB family)|nr:roadblock/LC7 domain-containing protein [Candidatus Cryosericum sp.]HPS69524.1 roadblock/LC7 domain-containing protein [Candidatus Cryosericum sp.]
MDEVLRNLNKEMGVTGSAIVSKDGLVIASALEQDAESVAGMAASVFQSAATTSTIMAIGTVGMITLESDQGKAFLVDLPDAFLVVLTTAEVNLGRLRIEIRKAAGQLKTQM